MAAIKKGTASLKGKMVPRTQPPAIQNLLGWAAFLLSAMKWRIGQEKYYKWKGSLFSIECGDSEKIKKIWELIWSIWNTKNDGKHKKNNTLSAIKSETVNSVLIEPEDMIKNT